MAKCKSCCADIVWIRTKTGRNMPCDSTPIYYKIKQGGNTTLMTLSGQVVICETVTDREKADGWGYVPHWSTCTHADKFRKRRR